MPVFYNENSQIKMQLRQPTLTRARHRYRGHRESYKINLEITQFLHDAATLYGEVVTMEEGLEDQFTTMLDGDEDIVTGVDVLGIVELTTRTQRLRDRVKRLEA